jgi:hypothetical protein
MKITKKSILLIIFCLAVGVSIVFVFALKPWPAGKKYPAGQDQESAQGPKTPQPAEAPIHKTSSTSDDWFFYNSARQQKDYEKCSQISLQTSRDICYKQVALALEDGVVCEQIGLEEKIADCKKAVGLKKARNSQNISACNGLPEFMDKIGCVKGVIAEKNYSDCGLLEDQEIRDYCESEKNYSLALENNNAEFCRSINSAVVRANCYSLVGGVDLFSDEDNDGLNYKKEIFYGTDPKNSDTDNDGYGDKVEVENDFNPSGQGMNPYSDGQIIILCEDISDDYLKHICLEESGDGSWNTDDCDTLPNPELKDDCLEIMASQE